MAVVGAVGWLGGIAAYGVGGHAFWLPVVLVRRWLVAASRQRRARVARLLAACALVAAGVVASAMLRSEVVSHGPLRELAEQRAVAELTGTVVSDPVVVDGQWGSQVVVRLRVHEVTARGATYRLGARSSSSVTRPGREPQLGAEVRAVGRMAPADEGEVAALVVGARPPVRIRGPDVWWRGAAAVRSSIRESVAGRPEAQRALVPALVVGDDAGLPVGLEQDFRTTGLTHLTAVSGTNLTLVVGFLLLLARSPGVRGRWLTLVGLLGIVGFVLLARTEPSVVRAAAMGTVGLFALGTDGRRRGLRALGVAVTGLLLVTPALAVSAGLRAVGAGDRRHRRPCATGAGGARAVAPDAGGRCDRGPVRRPARVHAGHRGAVGRGQPGGRPGQPAGRARRRPGDGARAGRRTDRAGVGAARSRRRGLRPRWCVGWIVRVAEWGADLPAPSMRWGSGALALAVLGVVCLAVGFAAPALLRRRGLGVALVVGSLIVVLGVPGRIASLPGGWLPRLAAARLGPRRLRRRTGRRRWWSRSRRGPRSSSTQVRIPTSSTAVSTGSASRWSRCSC